MSGFIKGENRYGSTLFSENLDEYVAEDNPVRVVDLFIYSLDSGHLVVELCAAAKCGRLYTLTEGPLLRTYAAYNSQTYVGYGPNRVIHWKYALINKGWFKPAGELIPSSIACDSP